MFSFPVTEGKLSIYGASRITRQLKIDGVRYYCDSALTQAEWIASPIPVVRVIQYPRGCTGTLRDSCYSWHGRPACQWAGLRPSMRLATQDPEVLP